MKKLLTILLCVTLTGYGQIMPGVLQQQRNLHNTPAPSGALELTWDDIANVPLCTYIDAPAPTNITVTPDAVGDNPVTWYYVISFAGGGECSLFTSEGTFIIGDATTSIILNGDEWPIWAEAFEFCIGTVSGIYTKTIEGTDPFPRNLMGYSWDDCSDYCYEDLLLWDVHQDCTPQDPSVVANWNTFFDLPTNGTPFTSVVVNGDSVYLYGGSGIMLKDSLFMGSTNTNLISVIDNANCIIKCGFSVFFDINGGSPYFCDNLTDISLPVCTICGDWCFEMCTNLINVNLPLLEEIGDDCFSGCSNIITLTLPQLTIAGSGCFSGCVGLAGINLHDLISCGNGVLYGCASLTSINLSSCTALGTTTGDDNSFFGITGKTITITIPHALETDEDIVYLKANNTVTVLYSD